MNEICYLNIVPEEILKYIISLTENKVFDLCLVNHYFNNNCKIIKIVNNFKYHKFTNVSLNGLTNIISLGLEFNKIITDEGIKGLINLTSLELFNNEIITDEGIKGLTNLTSLDLESNKIITDEGIKTLTNLTSHDLTYNDKITNKGIKRLINLTSLDLYRNNKITDEGTKDMKRLTKLTPLNLPSNNIVICNEMEKLINLTNKVHNISNRK